MSAAEHNQEQKSGEDTLDQPTGLWARAWAMASTAPGLPTKDELWKLIRASSWALSNVLTNNAYLIDPKLARILVGSNALDDQKEMLTSMAYALLGEDKQSSEQLVEAIDRRRAATTLAQELVKQQHELRKRKLDPTAFEHYPVQTQNIAQQETDFLPDIFRDIRNYLYEVKTDKISPGGVHEKFKLKLKDEFEQNPEKELFPTALLSLMSGFILLVDNLRAIKLNAQIVKAAPTVLSKGGDAVPKIIADLESQFVTATVKPHFSMWLHQLGFPTALIEEIFHPHMEPSAADPNITVISLKPSTRTLLEDKYPDAAKAYAMYFQDAYAGTNQPIIGWLLRLSFLLIAFLPQEIPEKGKQFYELLVGDLSTHWPLICQFIPRLSRMLDVVMKDQINPGTAGPVTEFPQGLFGVHDDMTKLMSIYNTDKVLTEMFGSAIHCTLFIQRLFEAVQQGEATKTNGFGEQLAPICQRLQAVCDQSEADWFAYRRRQGLVVPQYQRPITALHWLDILRYLKDRDRLKADKFVLIDNNKAAQMSEAQWIEITRRLPEEFRDEPKPASLSAWAELAARTKFQLLPTFVPLSDEQWSQFCLRFPQTDDFPGLEYKVETSPLSLIKSLRTVLTTENIEAVKTAEGLVSYLPPQLRDNQSLMAESSKDPVACTRSVIEYNLDRFIDKNPNGFLEMMVKSFRETHQLFPEKQAGSGSKSADKMIRGWVQDLVDSDPQNKLYQFVANKLEAEGERLSPEAIPKFRKLIHTLEGLSPTDKFAKVRAWLSDSDWLNAEELEKWPHHIDELKHFCAIETHCKQHQALVAAVQATNRYFNDEQSGRRGKTRSAKGIYSYRDCDDRMQSWHDVLSLMAQNLRSPNPDHHQRLLDFFDKQIHHFKGWHVPHYGKIKWTLSAWFAPKSQNSQNWNIVWQRLSHLIQSLSFFTSFSHRYANHIKTLRQAYLNYTQLDPDEADEQLTRAHLEVEDEHLAEAFDTMVGYYTMIDAGNSDPASGNQLMYGEKADRFHTAQGAQPIYRANEHPRVIEMVVLGLDDVVNDVTGEQNNVLHFWELAPLDKIAEFDSLRLKCADKSKLKPTVK